VQEANKRIEEQIESLRRRQVLWQKKYDSDVAYLVGQYDDLAKIDIDLELLAHKDLAVWVTRKQQQDAYTALIGRQTAWKQKQDKDISELEATYNKLSHIDIAAELQAHTDLAAYTQRAKDIAELEKYIARCVADEKKENAQIEKLKAEIEELRNHKCYACGQEMHDEKHGQVLADKQKALQEAALQALSTNTQWMENTDALAALGKPGPAPVTYYDKEADAFEHRASLGTILGQLQSKEEEADPYTEQIAEMQTKALEEIDYEEMNRLVSLRDHQDFLLKLLTSKDSYVRKRIIDQNLAYLNQRLSHYLDKIGLPHTVKFQNDLSVSIEELGRELDFDNLSRGERNRLILSMSWAFRDVWESLYSPINILFIDEMIDSGLDTQGVENALALLKKMTRERNKSIWLVSHRDELTSRVENILRVVKENGFTSYNTDVEIE
jgi:DNA repair exonuclease SbcCD ATPase subunit